MATTTATKTGVTDNAAGAGINEYLGLQGALAALIQAVGIVPIGDNWQIKGSLSFTPTLITDTLPPSPVLAWKVPGTKALLFTGGVYHTLAAATDYVRVCQRHFLFGFQATAAPAAPAAPTVAAGGCSDGIGSSGVYSYKVAPIDSFRREGPASVASSNVTLTLGSLGSNTISVTPPAAGTGVIGYNVYRTLAGGATWFYVGTTFGATAYIDASPDSAVDQTLTPSNTWTTGAIAGETMDGPGEVILESGTPAFTTAATGLVYTGAYGSTKQFFAGTFPTVVGQRIRYKLFGETSNFVAIGTALNNAWRGPMTTDVRTRHEEDLGAVAVSGMNAAPGAGALMVWGQRVIGSTGRQEATAAIKALNIAPTAPQGVLVAPNAEVVVEIGALAAGVAGVRDISLHGVLLPTAGT